VLLRVSLRLALGVYGVMSLICVVFTMLLPIETKGRPMVVRFLRSLLLLLMLLFVAGMNSHYCIVVLHVVKMNPS